jgi:hypothetical protein
MQQRNFLTLNSLKFFFKNKNHISLTDYTMSYSLLSIKNDYVQFLHELIILLHCLVNNYNNITDNV